MRTYRRSGSKDHPITLQKCDKDRTGSGGVTKTWDPPLEEIEVMASRKDSHGGEDYESNQKVGTGSTMWRTYWLPNVTAADWRVKDNHSGEVYDILSITMIGRRQEMELKTEIKDNE